MANGRTYKCPYCDTRLIRPKLITHIENKHEELIPEDYTAARVVFDMINPNSVHLCRVCRKPTTWNTTINKYNVLCDDPKCKEKLREDYKKNMIRVRGTYNILNDPEQQKKMLEARKISGKYQFSDGGVVGYTGEYEKKALEFMDNFMMIRSQDIISPGPTMEYTYKGNKHIYIPDFYYIPFNLIIEIKDGGDNPNKQMSKSRLESKEKTLEKERIITDKGEYNYIRLTNNQFVQLVEVFMEIKKKILEGDDSKVVKINESLIRGEIEYKVDAIADYFGYSKYADFKKIALFVNDTVKNFKVYSAPYSSIILKYKTQSPERFAKSKSGLPCDFVAYEANFFKTNLPKIEYSTHFIMCADNTKKVYLYPYLIFKYAGIYYAINIAFNKLIGIRGFKTKNDAINYMIYNYTSALSSEIPGSIIEVFSSEYDALDRYLYNIDYDLFISKLSENLSPSNFVRKDSIKPVEYLSKIIPD